MKPKTFKIFSLVIILSTLLAACSPSAPIEIVESNKRRETNPSTRGDDIKNLVDGNNTFAFDIYNSLRSENGNLILSVSV